jgi:fimbrial chaperone protein
VADGHPVFAEETARAFLKQAIRQTVIAIVAFFSLSAAMLTPSRVLQASLYVWTQDDAGNDRYTETEDLVFSPKILIFETNGEKMIRMGLRTPPGEKEKAYRLFIQEIPGTGKKTSGANTVVVALRFGLPIFVKPERASARVTGQKAYISGEDLHLVLRNDGNTHAMIRTVKLRGKNEKGETIFEKALNGWYLLAGATRDQSASFPNTLCSSLKKLDFTIDADGSESEGTLEITQRLCAS